MCKVSVSIAIHAVRPWFAAFCVQELSLLRTLRPCQMKPLRPEDIHKEELGFQYTSDQLPNIQNDVITISRWA